MRHTGKATALPQASMAAASYQADGKERGQPQQGGRLHRGIPASFASEYPAGINWNPIGKRRFVGLQSGSEGKSRLRPTMRQQDRPSASGSSRTARDPTRHPSRLPFYSLSSEERRLRASPCWSPLARPQMWCPPPSKYPLLKQAKVVAFH